MANKLETLVASAKSIVVTSHFSPDPDALASALLLTETLKLNYPDKVITMVLEERPAQNLSFLNKYDNITFAPIAEQLLSLKPDLFIITDTYTLDRVSRTHAADVRKYVSANNVHLLIIDHHAGTDVEPGAVMLNRHAPAAAQEVYNVCFQELSLKKPDGYQDMAMLGILTDTVRFRYPNPLMPETFAIASELLAAGANIQQLEDKLERYTDDQILVLSHLAANTTHESNYTYTFVDDAFYANYIQNGGSYADMKSMIGLYGDEFIRKIDGRRWGFTVYPDPETPHLYKASFRAITGAKDVLAIATALKGGGHVPAAAASVEGQNTQEVIGTVKRTINDLA